MLPVANDRNSPAVALRTKLRETETKIGRLITALAADTDDLPSVRAALAALNESVDSSSAVRMRWSPALRQTAKAS